jgi:hypothetical protein
MSPDCTDCNKLARLLLKEFSRPPQCLDGRAWNVSAWLVRSFTTVLAAAWESVALPDCTALSKLFRSVRKVDWAVPEPEVDDVDAAVPVEAAAAAVADAVEPVDDPDVVEAVELELVPVSAFWSAVAAV